MSPSILAARLQRYGEPVRFRLRAGFKSGPGSERIDGVPGSVMSKQTKKHQDVHTITDAHEAHSAEMHSRMVKYSISMGIRFICLVLIFFVEGWMVWILIAGAVFLPYIAVIIANAGSDNTLGHSDALLDQAPIAELEAGPMERGGAESDAAESAVLQGEVLDPENEAGPPGPASPTTEPTAVEPTPVNPPGDPMSRAPKNEVPPTV
jgi:Protein of unknown function (DUF3099)